MNTLLVEILLLTVHSWGGDPAPILFGIKRKKKRNEIFVICNIM